MKIFKHMKIEQYTVEQGAIKEIRREIIKFLKSHETTIWVTEKHSFKRKVYIYKHIHKKPMRTQITNLKMYFKLLGKEQNEQHIEVERNNKD
jgi:hypothetical protein